MQAAAAAVNVDLLPPPTLEHRDGCWMDPRPHRHVIHLLELGEPPWHAELVGIPRPRPADPPAPIVRRAK